VAFPDRSSPRTTRGSTLPSRYHQPIWVALCEYVHPTEESPFCADPHSHPLSLFSSLLLSVTRSHGLCHKGHVFRGPQEMPALRDPQGEECGVGGNVLDKIGGSCWGPRVLALLWGQGCRYCYAKGCACLLSLWLLVSLGCKGREKHVLITARASRMISEPWNAETPTTVYQSVYSSLKRHPGW
jgi:hypothetical protein